MNLFSSTGTLPDALKGLMNLPDLILLTIILASIGMGAKRGIIRTLCNSLGRMAAMAGAAIAAKLTAPLLARFIITPIIGEVFEVRAADLLSRMPAFASGFQAKATEMALEMAEHLAYFLLFFIFMFAMNVLAHMAGTALKIVRHIGPISVLNRFAGCFVGAVSGVLMCFLGLWALTAFAPSVFGELGVLSPDTVAGTTLTAFLLGYVPGA